MRRTFTSWIKNYWILAIGLPVLLVGILWLVYGNDDPSSPASSASTTNPPVAQAALTLPDDPDREAYCPEVSDIAKEFDLNISELRSGHVPDPSHVASCIYDEGWGDDRVAISGFYVGQPAEDTDIENSFRAMHQDDPDLQGGVYDASLQQGYFFCTASIGLSSPEDMEFDKSKADTYYPLLNQHMNDVCEQLVTHGVPSQNSALALPANVDLQGLCPDVTDMRERFDVSGLEQTDPPSTQYQSDFGTHDLVTCQYDDGQVRVTVTALTADSDKLDLAWRTLLLHASSASDEFTPFFNEVDSFHASTVTNSAGWAAALQSAGRRHGDMWCTTMLAFGDLDTYASRTSDTIGLAYGAAEDSADELCGNARDVAIAP